MTQSAIYLYGPSGTGKTTLGKTLAEALNLPFFDLDVEIEKQAGKTIPTIFAEEGEAAFRTRETNGLRGLPVSQPCVVGLGGGALLSPENRTYAESNGQILLLTAAPEAILQRLQADPNPRPLLQSAEPAQKLREYLGGRADHYASFPTQLDTTKLSPIEAVWQAQIALGMFHVRGMGAGYDVRVRAGGLAQVGEMMRTRELRGPIGIVSDETIWAYHGSTLLASVEQAGYHAHPVIIPPGESEKTMETVGKLWAGFLEAGLERSSTVLALGGGVVGDLAGFAAATYLRGVKWVALPTTLLAMVDASLGGKTGADLPQGKNLVGAFHAPQFVLADPDVLATLPPNILRDGMAEVVKHGIIADADLFALSSRFHMLDDFAPLVTQAMAVKIRVIQDDPFEQGYRQALNLGHTIGHGVEQASGFALSHGESIAIGTVGEARLAETLGIAQFGIAETIRATLETIGLPTEIPPTLDRAAILHAMTHDKKKKGGKVRFALPVRVGEVQVGISVDDLDHVLEAK